MAAPEMRKDRGICARPIGLVVSADPHVCAAVRGCGERLQVYCAGSSQTALDLLKRLRTLDLALVDAEILVGSRHLLTALARCGDPIRIVMSDDAPALRSVGPPAGNAFWDAQLVTARPPAKQSVLALIRSAQLRAYCSCV